MSMGQVQFQMGLSMPEFLSAVRDLSAVREGGLASAYAAIFASTKLPLTIWFLAMQRLTQAKNNVSALELIRQIGVCYRSAWLLINKHKGC